MVPGWWQRDIKEEVLEKNLTEGQGEMYEVP
jgi:hypothetical protein